MVFAGLFTLLCVGVEGGGKEVVLSLPWVKFPHFNLYSQPSWKKIAKAQANY